MLLGRGSIAERTIHLASTTVGGDDLWLQPSFRLGLWPQIEIHFGEGIEIHHLATCRGAMKALWSTFAVGLSEEYSFDLFELCCAFGGDTVAVCAPAPFGVGFH